MSAFPACRQDPGRVFKGKKMAGRMGSERVTVQNLKILRIDPVLDLLYIKGAVPGNAGVYIRVTDAVKGPFSPSPPPVPTIDESELMKLIETKTELIAPTGDVDVGNLKEPDDPY